MFCDESKASGFRLAAVAVAPVDMPNLRRVVNGLRLPGQDRLHFTNESDGRRKRIIKAFSAARVRGLIYDASRYRRPGDGVQAARRVAVEAWASR